MKNRRCGLLAVCGVVAAQTGLAEPVLWAQNGHSYEVVVESARISWADAQAAAVAKGGHLATLTSEGENLFVFNLVVSTPGAWTPPAEWAEGPWLGGYQDRKDGEPAGGWRWVTDEPWDYTHWLAGQPDDWLGVEDYLCFWGLGSATPTWNDAATPPTSIFSFVVEYESNPTPVEAAIEVPLTWSRSTEPTSLYTSFYATLAEVTGALNTLTIDPNQPVWDNGLYGPQTASTPGAEFASWRGSDCYEQSSLRRFQATFTLPSSAAPSTYADDLILYDAIYFSIFGNIIPINDQIHFFINGVYYTTRGTLQDAVGCCGGVPTETDGWRSLGSFGASAVARLVPGLNAIDIIAEEFCGWGGLGKLNMKLALYAEVPPDNLPPVANCINVTVSAGPDCNAEADVNDGSFDPDGDAITLIQDPPGPYSLGATTVTLKVTDTHGAASTCTATVTVEDREPPVAVCSPTTNPAGGTVPPAGKNPKSGQNPDGFYQLFASDNCDSSPKIYVKDLASAFIAGPFANGDKVKLTQAPGVTPNQNPGTGAIVAHIQVKGDARVYAVDAAGNLSTLCKCLVPPPPK